MAVQRVDIEGWEVTIVNGNYHCDCFFSRYYDDCPHIEAAKKNGGQLLLPIPSGKSQESSRRDLAKPEYVIAKVRKPAYEYKSHRLFIPLIGIPDAHNMEATICYYLLKYGYSMAEVRQLRKIPAEWSKKKIIAHIQTFGLAEYPEGWYNTCSSSR